MKKVVTLMVIFLLASSLFSILLLEVQAVPTLSNGYVTPTSGTTSTQFYYYVTYYDPGGIAPELATVNIDGNGWFMTLYNGIPSNGVYRYSTTLPVGTHTYYFMFTADSYTLYLPPPSTPYSGPTVTPSQCKLTVYSAHDSPNPPNGNWFFNDGQSVTCSVTSPVTEDGTLWTCTGWTGTGSVPSSGSGTLVTFTITQDSSITWNWQESAVTHTLTVFSAHDSPTPSNGPHTYNDGQLATCSVTSPVIEEGMPWICTGWTGTGSVPLSGSSASVTFPITQDSSITWNWHGDNHPLTPTTPQGPAFCVLYNDPFTYSSSSIDPENDNVRIAFDWDDGSANTQSDWVSSGDTVSVDRTWRELIPDGFQTGMHKVRAKATDIYGAESDWSPPLEVTVVGDEVRGNWAGYMTELTGSGSVTAIEGKWVQPRLDSISAGNDGTWIGIGGHHGRILQAGIMVTHFAWVRWRFCPFIMIVNEDDTKEKEILGPDPVSEGDLIHTSIVSLGGNQWEVSVRDITKGWNWTETVNCEPDLKTAEWIHEPGGNAGPIPFPWAPFSDVEFIFAELSIDCIPYKIGKIPPALHTVLHAWYFQKDDVSFTGISPMSEYAQFTISCLLSEMLPETPITGISLYSSANLSVYDVNGNHVGYNITTGLMDWQIPNVIFFQDETGTQHAILFAPQDYVLELVGNEQGDFHLHTTAITNETIVLDQWVNDTITIDEIKKYVITHQISLQEPVNSKTVVGHGYTCSLALDVCNSGNYTESFNLTVYTNTTIIGTRPVVLESANTTTITFTWNTTSFAYGNYTINVVAEHVPGEIDTADNTITGWVVVTITGDVDGDFDVDLFDAVKLLVVYGVKKDNPKYDSNCDIDGDGDIDLYDATLVLINYGKKYP